MTGLLASSARMKRLTSRWENQEDLTSVTLFNTSLESDFVNTQIIYVDDGILATVGKTANEL